MADRSAIEWTDASWNPIVGCSVISPGCTNCYAMRDAWRIQHNPKTTRYDGLTRKVNGNPVWTGEVRLVPEALDQPLRWKRPRRVFVNSMSDLFHESVPDEWIDQVFAMMALAPQHSFQVLTKRADRMLEYMTSIENGEDRLRDKPGHEGGWRGALIEGNAQRIWAERNPGGADPAWWLAVHLPLPNVWLGVSIEGPAYWGRATLLGKVPAAIRFLSLEPLLEGLGTHVRIVDDVDWAIVGGESGAKARPMNPEWVREIRDRCQAHDTAFHFKQWGEWFPGIREVSDDGPPWNRAYLDIEHDPTACDWEGGWDYHALPNGEGMFRVGKKRAGRMFERRTWDEFPKVPEAA